MTLAKTKRHVRKAVIPAAGLGTRFLPATKAVPKEMLPIVDKPAIQYIVEEAAASGIEELLIVVSPSKNAIADHFDYMYELGKRLAEKGKKKEAAELNRIADLLNITYVRQKEPLGLGHAIWCAREFVGNEPFGVLLGDDVVMANGEPPALLQCIKAFERTGTSVVGVQPVDGAAVERYGIVAPAGGKGGASTRATTLQVKDLVEKPKSEDAPSNLAILGRYVLTPDIFEAIAATKPDVRGEIELTDALRKVAKKRGVHARIFTGERYDIGSKFGLVEATIETALNRDDLCVDTARLILRIADEILAEADLEAAEAKRAETALKKPRKS